MAANILSAGSTVSKYAHTHYYFTLRNSFDFHVLCGPIHRHYYRFGQNHRVDILNDLKERITSMDDNKILHQQQEKLWIFWGETKGYHVKVPYIRAAFSCYPQYGSYQQYSV